MGWASAARDLKLIDIPALRAQLQLSGKLTGDNYLWTQGIVAALSELNIGKDGIIYESAHLGHGHCYALFDIEGQLIHESLQTLSECKVKSELVVLSDYTESIKTITIKEIFTKILGCVIVDSDELTTK